MSTDTRRARIFVDFWNFQLTWNDHSSGQKCDWTALPRVVINEASSCLASVGQTGTLELEETLLYASVDSANANDVRLKRWLTNFLDRQPSWRVNIRERRAQPPESLLSALSDDHGAVSVLF